MPGLIVVSAASLIEMAEGDIFLFPHPVLRLVRRGPEDMMGVRSPTSLKEIPADLPADGMAGYLADEKGNTKYIATCAEGGWLVTVRGGSTWIAPLTAKAKAKPPGKTIHVEQFCIESA